MPPERHGRHRTERTTAMATTRGKHRLRHRVAKAPLQVAAWVRQVVQWHVRLSIGLLQTPRPEIAQKLWPRRLSKTNHHRVRMGRSLFWT